MGVEVVLVTGEGLVEEEEEGLVEEEEAALASAACNTAVDRLSPAAWVCSK